MGMYTGLKFTVKLNAFGIEVVSALNGVPWTTVEGHLGGINRWDTVAKRFGHFGEWADTGRCDFIPFGSVDYVSPWPKQCSELKDGWWTVSCSLKDYNDEIQQFLDTVLPYLIDGPAKVRTKYEEVDAWNDYADGDFSTEHTIEPKVFV